MIKDHGNELSLALGDLKLLQDVNPELLPLHSFTLCVFRYTWQRGEMARLHVP